MTAVKLLFPETGRRKTGNSCQASQTERNACCGETEPPSGGSVIFEDKLSKFLKDSDDRLLDLRRNTESKRGGRGASRDR